MACWSARGVREDQRGPHRLHCEADGHTQDERLPRGARDEAGTGLSDPDQHRPAGRRAASAGWQHMAGATVGGSFTVGGSHISPFLGKIRVENQ